MSPFSVTAASVFFPKAFGLPEARVLEASYLQMQVISIQHPRGLHILREMYFGTHKAAFQPVSLQTSTVHSSLLLKKVSVYGVIRYFRAKQGFSRPLCVYRQ